MKELLSKAYMQKAFENNFRKKKANQPNNNNNKTADQPTPPKLKHSLKPAFRNFLTEFPSLICPVKKHVLLTADLLLKTVQEY